MSLRVAIASSSLLAFPTIARFRTLSGVEIVGFLSTPDRRKGRDRHESPNPFASKLLDEGHDVLRPRNNVELLHALESLSPDLVIVIAYGKLINQDALDIPERGWVNLHFSLLPAFRGAAPVQRALLRGEKEFGFSIFKLDTGMDSGPVYLRQQVEFPDTACATEILDRLAVLGADAFPNVIEKILKGEMPISQEGEPSFAAKFDRTDTHLDLSQSGEAVFNQIRAFTHSPGVWLKLEDQRILITSARPWNESMPASSLVLKNDSLILGTEGMGLELVKVIPEGRKEMTGGEFARGLRLQKNMAIKVRIS